jgi:transcriptional regulator with XRE-family HTH domain
LARTARKRFAVVDRKGFSWVVKTLARLVDGQSELARLTKIKQQRLSDYTKGLRSEISAEKARALLRARHVPMAIALREWRLGRLSRAAYRRRMLLCQRVAGRLFAALSVARPVVVEIAPDGLPVIDAEPRKPGAPTLDPFADGVAIDVTWTVDSAQWRKHAIQPKPAEIAQLERLANKLASARSATARTQCVVDSGAIDLLPKVLAVPKALAEKLSPPFRFEPARDDEALLLVW